jgi:hypothetical protein
MNIIETGGAGGPDDDGGKVNPQQRRKTKAPSMYKA